jgi:hypothetical protein
VYEDEPACNIPDDIWSEKYDIRGKEFRKEFEKEVENVRQTEVARLIAQRRAPTGYVPNNSL